MKKKLPYLLGIFMICVTVIICFSMQEPDVNVSVNLGDAEETHSTEIDPKAFFDEAAFLENFGGRAYNVNRKTWSSSQATQPTLPHVHTKATLPRLKHVQAKLNNHKLFFRQTILVNGVQTHVIKSDITKNVTMSYVIESMLYPDTIKSKPGDIVKVEVDFYVVDISTDETVRTFKSTVDWSVYID